MSYRILHCGKSRNNYNLSLEYSVAGFSRRGPEKDDIIFLAVSHEKQTLCGLRARLGETTDQQPWPDADRYVSVYKLIDIEYANPFDIRFLADYGGKYWPLKFLQGAKPIKDDNAIQALHDIFNKHLVGQPVPLLKVNNSNTEEEEEEEDDILLEVDPTELSEVLSEVPEAKINVMGTFQTIPFKNETDALYGLESLVNENFYDLFPRYSPNHSLLIPENRLFLSSGVEARGEKLIKGIRSIPDALLIIYSEYEKQPFKIAIIEYECFGEKKTRSQQKLNYFNGQVIPQLMRFASAFSIVTDKQIRDKTIKMWVDKIIDYIYKTPESISKVSGWIKQSHSELSDQLVGREIDRVLTEAFQNVLQILLIIDDLSDDQKDTITNVIRAFKLESGESIEFIFYIVRLEQRIRISDADAEYALSVQ
jgi:ACT domain-containing protein